MNHVIHYTVPAKNLAAEAEASERVQTKFTGQFANSVVGRAVQESRIPVDTVGSIKSVRIEDENRELPQLLKFMQKQGFLVIMMIQIVVVDPINTCKDTKSGVYLVRPGLRLSSGYIVLDPITLEKGVSVLQYFGSTYLPQ
ncbi:hypothetical protein K435DRAFT_791163 [Dendrothele bispora CBS 962.96]|uniref:Uncharacterized protein n=1 Tax=Dendrothele bispora (strain CBS 962.96) TaxID=1314807 RepID=A0A4S8MMI3_DENBC|nr:hypothetical protein K435DRAFT_791163 [Dendrothele bispora CBS 962.96]